MGQALKCEVLTTPWDGVENSSGVCHNGTVTGFFSWKYRLLCCQPEPSRNYKNRQWSHDETKSTHPKTNLFHSFIMSYSFLPINSWPTHPSTAPPRLTHSLHTSTLNEGTLSYQTTLIFILVTILLLCALFPGQIMDLVDAYMELPYVTRTFSSIFINTEAVVVLWIFLLYWEIRFARIQKEDIGCNHC